MVMLMALDDRDRGFEKALARRLREKVAGTACPDAETLAAYHERSLTPEEMNTWMQHTVACASCQEILAQLTATDEIAVSADQQQNAAAEGSNLFEAVYVPEEVLMATGQAAVASPTAMNQKAAAVVSLPQSPKRLRAAHWRWFAPAGALAAGLLVWVAIHENRPAKLTQSAKIEVAENRPPARPEASAAMAQAVPVEREKAKKLAPASKGAAAADTRAAPADELKNRRDKSAPKEVAPLSEGAFAKSDRKDEESDVVAKAARAATEGVGGGRAADASISKQSAEVSAQDRGETNLVQLQPSTPKPALSGPAPLAPTDSKTMKEAPPSPAAPETTLQLSTGVREAPALRMAKSRSPRPVSAPGGKVIWRLGMAGLIEQSTDGGLTWTQQISGTTADLYLGSAPSEEVCWVIGNGGTILRTTDGGAHWASVASPISQNPSLIRASDALHATVWDSSRRHGFQTDDGGVTWTQASGQ
jgi:Photosynthesis system II assembly factor YCF48